MPESPPYQPEQPVVYDTTEMRKEEHRGFWQAFMSLMTCGAAH
jgi:hypothetical protein